jgi:hypothetical protein
MEVGQGPNWGCSAKEKIVYNWFPTADYIENIPPLCISVTAVKLYANRDIDFLNATRNSTPNNINIS